VFHLGLSATKYNSATVGALHCKSSYCWSAALRAFHFNLEKILLASSDRSPSTEE
jgi:hypothetical protein